MTNQMRACLEKRGSKDERCLRKDERRNTKDEMGPRSFDCGSVAMTSFSSFVFRLSSFRMTAALAAGARENRGSLWKILVMALHGTNGKSAMMARYGEPR